jgi:hypothetical protein
MHIWQNVVIGKRTEDRMSVTMKVRTFRNVKPRSLREVSLFQRNSLPYIIYPDDTYKHTHI